MKLAIGTYVRDYSVSGGVTYDADAQAYFTANTAITSAADKNAINTFYLGLKTDSIYNLINGMHLPIWQNASANKWNLVNPLDTDTAFRLTYATGILHEVNGIRGNGTSAYCNTYFAPSIYNNYDNQSFGSYVTINNNQSGIILGSSINAAGGPRVHIQPRNTSNLANHVLSATVGDNVANTSSLGFFQAVRNSGTTTFFVKNTTVTNFTRTGTTNIDKNLYYLALNQYDVSISSYSTKRFAFSYFGQALTTTQATNFYNRVQTLMTHFGIQV